MSLNHRIDSTLGETSEDTDLARIEREITLELQAERDQAVRGDQLDVWHEDLLDGIQRTLVLHGLRPEPLSDAIEADLAERDDPGTRIESYSYLIRLASRVGSLADVVERFKDSDPEDQ